jgi:hypothetical protein
VIGALLASVTRGFTLYLASLDAANNIGAVRTVPIVDMV